MNEILKVYASLSLSGSLLIFVILLCRALFRDRFGWRWQYYVWLIAVVRLLLPLAPEASPVDALFRRAEGTEPVTVYRTEADTPHDALVSPAVPARDPAPSTADPEFSAPEVSAAILQNLWAVWLGAALALLVRRITAYQSFVRYIRAGCEEVFDVERLDRLAQLCGQMEVKRPVELYVNRLAASPMLLGFFRPCIVLPDANLSDDDFQYTVRHELVHCRRWDTVYKWLVQLTVCLHWFNPLVWLMGREISRTCELSCDEAVIRDLDPQERRAYGGTLLHAMAAGGRCPSAAGSVTLNESGALLKERLGAIMNFKQTSRLMRAASFALAAVLLTGAAAAGAYTGAARRAGPVPAVSAGNRDYAALAEEYYEEGTVGGFSAALRLLDRETQKAYLEKCYNDGNIAFFAACLNLLDADSALLASYAEKAYADKRVNFFSVLANHMDTAALEEWTARAVKDRRTSFQAVLLTASGKDEELEAMKAELEKQRVEEYAAHGIDKKGTVYYYQDQLVNIFMDLQSDHSFVTLDRNPLGTVNVKVTRDKDGKIQSAGYMTEAEAAELLSDMNGLGIIGQKMNVPDMETLEVKGVSYYLVTNEAQLRSIGTGGYGMDKNYMQQADIELSGEWVPIGTAEKPFTGSYNGNGFEIRNLTMTDPDAEIAGLFGVAKKAHIYNITLRDCDIADAGKNVPGKSVGAILAVGQGSRSYDNFVYPKAADGDGAVRMSVEELPEEARKLMDNCSTRIWYLIHSGGRQYIWYDGFAWQYGWRLEQSGGSWKAEVMKLKKRDAGYVLLSLPDGAPVAVTCDGQPVTLTDIQ